MAHSQPYDPDSELCDYSRTTWEAEPNEYSMPVAHAALWFMHRNYFRGQQMDEVLIPPFVERAPKIVESAERGPLMLISDHHPDMQAALIQFGAAKALAMSLPGDYLENLVDMFKISRNIGTRGFVPIVVHIPRTPWHIPFVNLSRLIVSSTFTFPNNSQIRESGIPPEFMSAYNALAKQEIVAAAQTEHHPGISPNLFPITERHS